MSDGMEPGCFCWNELTTNDPKKAASFYESLFGWEAKTVDMGGGGTYTLLENNGTQVGGIQYFPENAGPMTPQWASYVYVKNVDEACEKAVSLGADVVQTPTDIPGIGRFAFVKDPTGASVALLENKKA